MATYRTAEQEVIALMEHIKQDHHQELVEAGVTVLLQTAHAPLDKAGVPRGHALKCHGTPAHAVASLIPEKDRVAGLPDCRIVLDGDDLPNWTAERLTAILDHELLHFAVRRDKHDGSVLLDDAHRPKMRLRPHDAELGILWEIVQRHGHNEPQVEHFEEISQRMGEMDLPCLIVESRP